MNAKKKLDILSKFITAYRDNTEKIIQLYEGKNDEETENARKKFQVRIWLLRDIETLLRDEEYLMAQYNVFYGEDE